MKKYLLILLSILYSSVVFSQGAQLSIVGSKDNDVIKILKENQISFDLFESIKEAVKKAKPNNALLLFADSYPRERLELTDQSVKAIQKKNLRVYIEFPENIPGLSTNASTKVIKLERGIINTRKIDGLDSLDLLGVNDHQFIPIKANDAFIVLGKVAGYDKADYGIDDVEVYPLLFKHNNFLIATTKLSDVITSRFGPEASWIKIWEFIFNEIDPKQSITLTKWITDLHPSYLRDEKLPNSSFKQSINKGAEWFYNARLFIHPNWQDTFKNRTSNNGIDVVYPAIDENAPIGDGSLGILEGHSSFINSDGSQPVRWWLRADCQAEVAFALTSSSSILNKKDYNQTAINLLQNLYKKSNLRSDERSDPKSPSFGLIGWATTDPDAYYGDDNARVLLSTIGASANLNTDEWDKYILEGILGNFRTAGINGFRGPWFRDAAMQKTDWQTLGSREIINIHPHYESWLWACYLWLYDKTGYKPLLKKAKEAITITMEKYPNWKWTNGIQQEYARMILPLAWLVRIEDTQEHRGWLDTVANKLLEDLQKNGAISEKLGKDGLGRYGRIASNAEYGLKEAPLISDNRDPVADLLYTMNFAFFTLNEAASATNNPKYQAATKRIAEFMKRIQVNSPKHKELDGAWFRAFDYERWDYWASNADSGWGPWGTLTGWTQSWIINSLILEEKNENFWDNSKRRYKDNDKFKAMAQEKVKTMLSK